jgi:hypothetical protein
VRRKNVVASVALTAILALFAVPGLVGSRALRPAATVDPGLFRQVEIATLSRGMAMTIQPQDPGARSAGHLDQRSIVIEPDLGVEPPTAPVRRGEPVSRAGSLVVARAASTGRTRVAGGWHHDNDISWFGPGLYGNGTACGQTLTKTLVGVAHRTLPCGTRVTFRYKGVTLTVPVVDRGPFVAGRTWDLTHGACAKLAHCFTGSIDWKLAGS